MTPKVLIVPSADDVKAVNTVTEWMREEGVYSQLAPPNPAVLAHRLDAGLANGDRVAEADAALCVLYGEASRWFSCFGQLRALVGGNGMVTLAEVLARFDEDDAPRDAMVPLAPLIRDYDEVPEVVEADGRDTAILPTLPTASKPGKPDALAGLRPLPVIRTGAEPPTALPTIPTKGDDADPVPLLALLDRHGNPPEHVGGRAAPLPMRLMVDALLRVRHEDRHGRVVALPTKLGDLVDALHNRRYFRPKRDWPKLRHALEHAYDWYVTYWHPTPKGKPIPYELHVLTVTDVPTAWDPDAVARMVVTLPQGSGSGPIISKELLRQKGLRSSSQYRACIAAASRIWLPGVTRVFAPKAKRRLWTLDPDAYPVVTLDTLRNDAFGNTTKHYSRAQVLAAFEEQPNVELVPIPGRKSAWRLIPAGLPKLLANAKSTRHKPTL